MEDKPPSSLQKYVSLFKEKISDKRLKMFFIALVLLFVFFLQMHTFFFNKFFIREQQAPSTSYRNNTVLFVNKVTPNDEVALPKKIVFEFSDPVDLHLFEHSFFISPDIQGRVSYGSTQNIIEFTPIDPLQKGIEVSFTIKAGLPSLNGKNLLVDYVGGFSTVLKDNEVQFVKDEIAGKVLSYAKNQPIRLSVRKSLAGEMSVSVYKSTQANLLNFLVYKKDISKEGLPIPYSERFIQSSMPHAQNLLLETFTVENNDEKKNLQLPEGVYYAEATYSGSVVGSTFIIVNSIGLLVRQDDKKITLSSYDLNSNQSFTSQANVGFYNMENGPNQLTTFSFNSLEKSYNFDFKNRLDLVIGTINNETVFVPLQLPQSQADISATNLDETYKLFFYTDRPIYKPKDVVKFSGIVRIDSDSQYKLAGEGKQIKISLGYDSKYNMIVTTNAHGVFSGEMTVPEDTNGTQYLYAFANFGSSSDTYSAVAYFDVVSYVKPTFELSSTVEKPEYLRNEKIRFNIKGNYFDGQPLKNEEVTYMIYSQTYYEVEKSVYNSNFNVNKQGGMCGGRFGLADDYYGEVIGNEKKIKLDENGKAVVEISLPSTVLNSAQLTLVVQKKDRSNNNILTAANVIVHGAKYNIFFIPSAQNYFKGEEVVAPFYAEDLEGNKINNKEFNFTLVKSVYNGNESTEETIISGKTTTDENGTGIIKFNLPNNYTSDSKYLIVETIDSLGNKAQTKKYISVLQDKNNSDTYSYWSRNSIEQTYLKIVSSKNNFKVGDKISLMVRSPKELDALVSLERGRIYEPQVIRLFPGDNKVEFNVNADLSPSITVVFSFFADGEYHTEGVALNVPAMHKLLNVSLTSNKSKYNPTETANLTIKTTDPDNNPVPANLTLNIVDKAIFALKKNATPPIHSSLYYFRPRSTNASSSLTLVGTFNYGGRGGGGGGSNIGSTVDTLYWNPDLATDVNGMTVVEVPLQGHETTWKALVIGATDNTYVGQDETEFIVTSKEVLGEKKSNKKAK